MRARMHGRLIIEAPAENVAVMCIRNDVMALTATSLVDKRNLFKSVLLITLEGNFP